MDDESTNNEEYWKNFEKWFGEIIDGWKASGAIKRVMSGLDENGLPDNSKPPASDKYIFDEMNEIFKRITSNK